MDVPANIVRNYPRETWRWFWPDVLIRLVPFWAVALVAMRFMGGPAAIGLAAPGIGWIAAIGLGLAIGVAMTVLAMLWRRIIAPGYRLPTLADQALQSFFYLILNAPTEEVFWRGVVQTLAIRGLLRLGMGSFPAILLGVAGISMIFGAYHRLGGYSWRFNIAAMLAGALFGLLYALLPGPSIVVPAIVHGLTTAGFLSWGDAALFWRHMRRMRNHIASAG
jgi:uncharacterized protein